MSMLKIGSYFKQTYKTLLYVVSYCFITLLLLSCNGNTEATSLKSGTATYLGNEGIMIEHANTKILFDPFFHNTFNTYQSVPDNIRTALFTNQAPYDEIDFIFISHAHADHFSSGDLAKFLRSFPESQLVAPKQAIEALVDLEDAQDLTERMHAIELEYQDKPINKSLGDIKFDAVRIPHAGWPQRAGISNLVFRVTLNNAITVVHMGDADPNDVHFKPLLSHWEQQKTNTAFPPYWFMTSESGQMILKDRIKADTNIGIHVPIAVPQDLLESGEMYYSNPGETTQVSH